MPPTPAFSAVDRMVQLDGLALGYRHDAAIRLERLIRDLRCASLNYAHKRLQLVNGPDTEDRSVSVA
ncbi:hypothetical protein ACF09Y_24725 [Streptomyces massasporeus]|uniref:hypothetical protein n=1 Tax=Streptomyces massasporeus TaxID=67324 RepID=UPI0036FEFE3A